MSDRHKSNRRDLIYMFNATSRYLDDIFTIDTPKFEKYIPDIWVILWQLKLLLNNLLVFWNFKFENLCGKHKFIYVKFSDSKIKQRTIWNI